MAGEETGKSRPKPLEIVRLITDFTRMMKDEEKETAERERWLETNIEDDTLREVLTISGESETTERFVTKLQEAIPMIYSLFTDQAQLEQFDQEFSRAMEELDSEIADRRRRLDEINASLE